MQSDIREIVKPRPETAKVHEHDWRIGFTKNVFEPFLESAPGVPLYTMTEYAYMLCKCGVAKKNKIEV